MKYSLLPLDLPSLLRMEFEKESVYGDENEKSTATDPYNYRNNMTLRNLPLLNTFALKNNRNFMAIGRVVLERTWM